MIKQLLAKNKIVQRVKAVKDLFLEKLDSLSHAQLEQVQKLEKLNQLDPLDFKVEQLNNSTEQIRQENAETKRKADLSLQNQAFLLKFSVDIVKNLQLLTGDWKQKGDLILNTLLKNHEDSQKTAYQQSSLILDALQKIQEANQKILEDIHTQKYKVIIDQKYFQDLDIELMTYLYSYLPHRRAVDIGANRGDVSSRLLQAGYQVYAFEPFPPVIDKLKNRLGNHPNFQLFPLAIGSENQTQELHIATDETPDNTYQDASFYSSLTKHSLSEGLVFTDTITVTVKTLASLHDGEELPKDIGLVKIDTEGFDLEVIKGMGNYRYPVVVAEFWDKNFPFGRSGAMNKLPDLVKSMK